MRRAACASYGCLPAASSSFHRLPSSAMASLGPMAAVAALALARVRVRVRVRVRGEGCGVRVRVRGEGEG